MQEKYEQIVTSWKWEIKLKPVKRRKMQEISKKITTARQKNLDTQWGVWYYKVLLCIAIDGEDTSPS